MSKYPAIEFANPDPLQDFYVSPEGHKYSAARMVDFASDYPVFDCPLAALDLSDEIWRGADIFSLAYHCKKVMEADLDHPILIDWRGSVADGRHRIIKALIEGRTTIKARRMIHKMDPCEEAE